MQTVRINLAQLLDDTSGIVLIENNEDTSEWGCNLFSRVLLFLMRIGNRGIIAELWQR